MLRHLLRVLLLTAFVIVCGCGGALPPPEVVAAHVVGRQTNEAIDELAVTMRAEGMVEIRDSVTADEARERLERVEARWAPVWAAVEAFREAHGDYADALEGKGDMRPEHLLPVLRASYCVVRLEARASVTMPDFPGEPCP